MRRARDHGDSRLRRAGVRARRRSAVCGIGVATALVLAPQADAQSGHYAMPSLPFGWSISNSTTNPYANTGAPEQGYSGGNLYLWIACAGILAPPDDGWSMADLGFELVPGPDGPFPVTYADLSLSTIVNPYPDLRLMAPAGCPTTPMLTGVFGVPADPAAAVQNFALCFGDYAGPGSTGMSRTVDCPSNGADEHPIEWIGFHRGTAMRCRSFGDLCYNPYPDAVVERYWGDVKGLYR